MQVFIQQSSAGDGAASSENLRVIGFGAILKLLMTTNAFASNQFSSSFIPGNRMRVFSTIVVVLFLAAPVTCAENLLEFDLSHQDSFVRQVRGWQAEKSEGEWLGYKWAFGAWDDKCLFEVKLGKDADGVKYISLANLEGQPSLMFFRVDLASLAVGSTATSTFMYRTTGTAQGLFFLTIGKQEEKISLPTSAIWKAVTLTETAKEAGSLGANWRNVSAGASEELQLKDLVVTTAAPAP